MFLFSTQKQGLIPGRNQLLAQVYPIFIVPQTSWPTGSNTRIQSNDPVTQAYQLAFQRNPTTKEHQAATQLISMHGTEAFCRALLNANELLYLE